MTPRVCEHRAFTASVSVVRLEDVGRFVAEVRITCKECGVPMQFLGLDYGYNIDGANVSADGLEARLGVFPQGTIPPTVEKGK